MIWLDQKYIGFLGPYLEEFKKIDNMTYNFRCPICGDSKHKRKKRGYFYFKKGKYSFYCHNCMASMGLQRFLKDRHPDLYGPYLMEKMAEEGKVDRNSAKEIQYKFKKPEFANNENFRNLPKISSLPHTHPAKEYIAGRKIPNPWHAKMYYVEEFKAWVNKQIPNKFEEMDTDHPRIIIPLIDKDKKLVGVQGRALHDTRAKYISIMFDGDDHKLFNMDQIDFNKDIYVFEGPFDAMFIPNSIAVCGGHLTSELIRLDDFVTRDKFVVINDNEPRNKDIVRNIGRSIQQGFRTVLWPKTFPFKDLNDAILGGWSVEQVKQTIDHHTYQGLAAELEFNTWKK